MTQFDDFQWQKDDYQTNLGHGTQPGSLIKYEERVTRKKRKGGALIAGICGGLVGAMLMGVFSMFALPYVSKQFNINLTSGQFAFPKVSIPSDQTVVTPIINQSEERQELSTVEIGKRVGPAVVGVVTKITYQGFFGRQTGGGSGSGIIITTDGYIITNNHVIENANEISVVLSNGKEFKATAVGSDAKTDIAVLKIEAQDLTTAVLGDSSLIEAGERAIAIGNPLGLELAGSITQGCISAVNRSMNFDNTKLPLIQTDAAINPGNSGGALVNAYGEVIGINTVKVSGNQVEGIGFAIPVNEVKPIVEDLINSGYVKGRPLIGLQLRYITKEIAEYNDLPCEGLFVVQVTEFSAAEAAGIMRGDIVIACNDEEVKSVEELNEIRDKHKAGDTIRLKVNRNGEIRDFDVTLKEDKPVKQTNPFPMFE